MIMNKHLILIFAFFFSVQLKAQTLKPDVFVVGNGNAAAAAAIQAAQSNVKTILLLQAGGFDTQSIDADIHAGIQLAFLEKMREHQKLSDKDTVLRYNKLMANEVLTKWTDSLKNLTVIKNVVWVKAKRAGKGWVFKLADGKTIRPEVLINTADQKLNQALEIDAANATTWNKLSYDNTIYKTNVATGKLIDGTTSTGFSLYQLLFPEQENLVYINDPSSMLLGQAAGAIAAYAGFFNRKTSESDLKAIQGELIAFKANLMPFADVKLDDPNWRAIQMVGITGVIKGEQSNGQLYFMPEKKISTDEIKQPIKAHYYKAQIWFDDYKSDIITVGAALDMICYVGNKAPESTKKEVEKKWKTSYAFSSDFDLERQITRREFVSLLQDYMPPFNVTINKNGKILR
jgi:hypothetical protein